MRKIWLRDNPSGMTVAPAFRLLMRIILSVSICVVVLVIVAAAWLGSAPRQIDGVTPYIIDVLEDQPWIQQASLQAPLLYFNRKTLALELGINELKLELAGGSMDIERIRLDAPFRYLLRRKLGFNTLLVDNIVLTPVKSEPVVIPSLYLKPDKGNINHTSLTLHLDNVADDSQLTADIEMFDKYLTIDTTLQQVPASLLSLMSIHAAGLEAFVNGTIHVTLGKELKARYIHADMKAENVAFTHPEYYPQPLNIDSLAARAEWKANEDIWHIAGLDIHSGTAAITGEGRYHPDDTLLDLQVARLDVNDLERLWPQAAAAEARAWVTAHLFDGYVKAGNVMFSHRQGSDPVLNASLPVRKMRVKYAPHLPEITNAKALVTLGYDTLNVDIQSGTSLEHSHLKSGTLKVGSFATGAAPMDIALTLVTNAKDVATFLSKNYLNKAQSLNLQPQSITGTIEGTLKLNFPLHPERAGLGKSSFDTMTIDIAARANNITQQGMLGDLDIADFSGNIALNNAFVAVTNGKGLLNGVTIAIDAKHIFAQPADSPTASTSYQADMVLPANRLNDFAIPIPSDIISGDTHVTAKVEQKQGIKHINATLDFADARLALSPINWIKAKRAGAVLVIDQTVKESSNTINSLDFRSDDLSAKGSLIIGQQGGIEKASLPDISFKGKQLALAYENGSSEKITLSGEAVIMDASSDGLDDNSDMFSYLKNREIDVRLDALEFGDVALRDLIFTSNCDAIHCSSLLLNANYGDKDVISATISNNSPRQFEAKISNLGLLLHMLDISKGVRGGILAFNGAFNDKEAARPLMGKLFISNMIARDAPLLTKLLSVASLRGLSDTVSGKGIAFGKTTADITYSGDIIRIDDAIAKGDAMGVLMDGKVTLGDRTLFDLSGTVIPSYTLNALPGKVPLIGELLVGGENEGLFGVRFDLEGSADNPNVSVNPLSMITPGFTRNIFNLFSDDE